MSRRILPVQGQARAALKAPWGLVALVALLWLGAGTPSAAAGREAWVEVRSPHFVAYCDAGEAEARKALEGFEGIRSVFSAVLPGIQVDLHKPIVVIVTANQASMQRFLPEAFAGKDPKRPSGMYLQGRERDLAIIRLDIGHQENQPFAVVFHEYTHAIVHNHFARLPTWLDEGIADFYGSTEIRSKRVYLGRIPFHHLDTLRRLRMPLKAVLQVTHDSPEYREGSKANMFYAQSWAMVHHLFLDEQARKADRLGAYLRALSRQPDPLLAAQEGFGDLTAFEGLIAQYASRPSLPYLDLPLQIQLSDKDFRVRTVPEAEALVLRAEVLAQTGRGEEASLLLDQARDLAPKLPQVHAARGLQALQKGDWSRAEADLLVAQASGSTDFRVPLRLAELALLGRMASPAPREQVLEWLEAAARLEPDFPEIHLALGRFHAKAPQDPDKAMAAVRTALRLAPSDLALRLNVGGVFMALGREDEARAMGEHGAKVAASDWERQAVASYQTQLQAFLEFRAARAKPPVTLDLPPQAPPPPPGQPLAPSRAQPLRFWLPDSLSSLRGRVQMAVMEGRLDEAIQMVKEALPAAKGPYEKPSLKALLEHLKARKAGH